MNRHLILLLIVVALVMAAYSPLPAPVSPSTSALSPQQAYLTGAQKEGVLKFYTSLNDREAKALLEEFTQEYPFLKVDYDSASSSEILHKVLTEAKASLAPSDELDLDGTDMVQLDYYKLLSAYKSPEAASYPDATKHARAYYTTGCVNEIVIAYNTKQVEAEAKAKKPGGPKFGTVSRLQHLHPLNEGR